MPRRYILAVDPAKRSGWSLWTVDGACLCSGVADMSKAKTLYRADDVLYATWREMATAANVDVMDPETPLTLVLEEPWGRFFRSLRKQAEYLALWESMYGHGDVIRVNPATWQSAVLCLSNKTKRAARKASAQKIAAKIAERDVGEDEADAICIGLWAVGKLARKQ